MDIKKYLQNLDWWLVGAVCLLSLFGLICIASATCINLGESPANVIKQGVFFLIGIALMVIAANADYEYISQFTIPLYIVNILLLVTVLLVGSESKGATRWIALGPLTIQPSEFAKVIMIFCLAKVITERQKQISDLKTIGFLCIYTGIPLLLIQKQPALSASLVLVAIFCIEIFIAGLDWRIIRNVLVVTVPIVALILFDVSREHPLFTDKILAEHQFNRILSFVDPSRDASLYYQTEKSISAIGSGKFLGKGLFHGTLNQLSYLPEPHNDFIFSVIGEEFGFLGCIFVLAILLFIVFRCIVIAISARDTFSQLVAAGIAGMFAFQTFVNMGVATGILPNTGMSLPFISYGGSSMWTNMVALGLMLNIRKKETKSLFEGGLL